MFSTIFIVFAGWFFLFWLIVALILLNISLYAIRYHVQTTYWENLKDLRYKVGADGSKKRLKVVGFFHPYCNAGGGGERVLWMAILALLKKYGSEKVRCVIYTGDIDSSAEQILLKARQRFQIAIPEDFVHFVYLKRRKWIEADMYPYFTMFGQSLGSMWLGWEALTNFVPDIYIDSMGYAFTVVLFRYFAQCLTACYVHYPTISTDMLKQVEDGVAAHNNPNFISESTILSQIKVFYYRFFAWLYGIVGSGFSIVLCNGTWTRNHIDNLWKVPAKTKIVHPPVDVLEFLQIPLRQDANWPIQKIISLGQFRPEKDHELQIKAFHKFLSKDITYKQKYRLQLVGSCRNAADINRVFSLRKLCSQLKLGHITYDYLDSNESHDLIDTNEALDTNKNTEGDVALVEFHLNVTFDYLKKILSEATVGLHTMWNEHFGIAVVECMAAGCIILAHDSGGPKLDTVSLHGGKVSGFRADSVDSYAEKLEHIFRLSNEERTLVRVVAREKVDKFADSRFIAEFISHTEPLFQETSP